MLTYFIKFSVAHMHSVKKFYFLCFIIDNFEFPSEIDAKLEIFSYF